MGRIDFLGLEAFLGIANWGTFSRAAASLNLSQAALSHRLKKLEADLGTTLIARTTRHVTLSPAGVELLPTAQRVLDELSHAFDKLRLQAKQRQDFVRIGCIPTVAVNHLPRILKSFGASYPDTAVRILDGSATAVVEHVRSGEAEFGVTIVSSEQFDLDIVPIYQEPFALLCPSSHDLARKRTVTWSDLDGVHLIKIGGRTGSNLLIDAALSGRFGKLTWKYEVDRIQTAVGMVAAGIGLTVAPRLALDAAGARDVVALSLRNPGIARTIGIVTRRGEALSPMIETLAKSVRDYFDRLKTAPRRH